MDGGREAQALIMHSYLGYLNLQQFRSAWHEYCSSEIRYRAKNIVLTIILIAAGGKENYGTSVKIYCKKNNMQK